MIKYLTDSHDFFVRESPWFVGDLEWHDRGTRYEYAVPHLNWKQSLYYPIAYVKFMRLCIFDHYG